MDNFGVHKAKGIKEILNANFDIQYTSYYSPKAQMIEELFSLVKNRLRRKIWKND